MEAQHMTQQTFANFIGMSPASLSSIFNDRTKPTLNTVEAIKSKIPNLSTDWLMFGYGSMFKNDNADNAGVANDDGGMRSEQSLDFGDGAQDLFSQQARSSYQSANNRVADSSVRTEIKHVERPQRQITEIKIYFDDLTYETFVPKK